MSAVTQVYIMYGRKSHAGHVNRSVCSAVMMRLNVASRCAIVSEKRCIHRFVCVLQRSIYWSVCAKTVTPRRATRPDVSIDRSSFVRPTPSTLRSRSRGHDACRQWRIFFTPVCKNSRSAARRCRELSVSNCRRRIWRNVTENSCSAKLNDEPGKTT